MTDLDDINKAIELIDHIVVDKSDTEFKHKLYYICDVLSSLKTLKKIYGERE